MQSLRAGDDLGVGLGAVPGLGVGQLVMVEERRGRCAAECENWYCTSEVVVGFDESRRGSWGLTESLGWRPESN